ncbi:hypothetical protein EXN66_Car012608 [Channa argus]|uniref:Uncharacterized protein n=1 Tax=Channa argus TaxID=215402 RepID=A0A6G1Q3A2_CHAAH|nr:hypothetical protein EXN66_Car012608 [Channa argus]
MNLLLHLRVEFLMCIGSHKDIKNGEECKVFGGEGHKSTKYYSKDSIITINLNIYVKIIPKLSTKV